MNVASDEFATGVVSRRAALLLRKGILEEDLNLKQVADRLSRSIGTVKRALNGSMGERTVYRILKEFGGAEDARMISSMIGTKNEHF